MFRVFVLMLCFLAALPITAYSANDDLRDVLFRFDEIPCGAGTMKGASSIPFPSETSCNGVPVIAHIYIKDFKRDFESYKPLDPYIIMSYYREKINNNYDFTLIGYTRRYYLGSSKKDISANYAKIRRDLVELLGPESNMSSSTRKSGMNESSFWLKPRKEKGLGIILTKVEIQKKPFASIEVLCLDEYLQFLAREEDHEKEKQNQNLFK